MKRLLALIMGLLILMTSFAFAEGLDLSAFTPEQLAALQEMLNAEMESREEPERFTDTISVLKAMINAGAPIKEEALIDYTAETDPNGSMGTVGSYSHKTDFVCEGYTSAGGTIEYFEEEEYANNRYDYIMNVYIATPMLADMTMYKIGNYVLRIDEQIETVVALATVHSIEEQYGKQVEKVFDPHSEITIDLIRGVVEDKEPVEATKEPVEPAATEAPVYSELKRGAKGAEVAKVQSRLKALGFLNGLADGDFGPATENAVKAFQEANNLDVNGIASVRDQEILFAAGAVDANGNIAKEFDPYEVCPIEITNVDLRSSYGYNYVIFKAKNISGLNVRAVNCCIRYFDAFGDRMSSYGTSEYTVSIADIAAGKTVSYSTSDNYDMIVQDAAVAAVAVTRVLMEDGTDLHYNEPVWFEGK